MLSATSSPPIQNTFHAYVISPKSVPINKKHPPDTVVNTQSTSNMEAPDAKNIDEDTMVPYKPLFGETLGEVSTSRIARVAPGVIIKCPRFAWYYSEKAAEKCFVQDM